jgi:transposase
MNKAQEIILNKEEKDILEKWLRSKTIPHQKVIRAQIIINASKGLSNKEISEKMEISEHYVGRWRSRFYKDRISGIEKDHPKTGRPLEITPELVKKIIDTTLFSKPEGETHWSTRSLAKKLGINHMIVYRVWKTHNIKPHLTRSFKFSKDPKFIEKLIDVVGLYMNPPEHAIVFSMDEKTQIQALERTQTILPIRPGLPEGRSHDYKRNGTIDLFAALNILNGKVITQFHDCHTRKEFLLFF